jgi:hypothetical protein
VALVSNPSRNGSIAGRQESRFKALMHDPNLAEAYSAREFSHFLWDKFQFSKGELASVAGSFRTRTRLKPV